MGLQVGGHTKRQRREKMYCQQTHIISGKGIAKMKYIEYRLWWWKWAFKCTNTFIHNHNFTIIIVSSDIQSTIQDLTFKVT